MSYRSQAELDEALRTGTVADATVVAEEGSEAADTEVDTDDEDAAAGKEPVVSKSKEVKPAKVKRKSRP